MHSFEQDDCNNIILQTKFVREKILVCTPFYNSNRDLRGLNKADAHALLAAEPSGLIMH